MNIFARFMSFMVLISVAALNMGDSCDEPTATGVTHYCVPRSILEDTQSVRVECVRPSTKVRCGFPEDPPGSGNDVTTYAVKSDLPWSRRFAYMANMAITSGATLRFSFSSGIGGPAFGCEVDEKCRVPYDVALVTEPPPWPNCP